MGTVIQTEQNEEYVVDTSLVPQFVKVQKELQYFFPVLGAMTSIVNTDSKAPYEALETWALGVKKLFECYEKQLRFLIYEDGFICQ